MKTKATRFFICIILYTSFQMPAKAQAVNVQDSLALVDLYNSTNGPEWKDNKNNNWLKGPVSIWSGITLKNDRVKIIRLINYRLVGSISASIGNLSELTTFDLQSNSLQGSIPASIGNLSNLITLDLHINQLSNLPAEIGNLSNLTNLYLQDNQISNFPAEIGNLKNLTNLHLEDNLLQGNLPAEIGNLKNLTNLYLYSNKLTGIPVEIGKLSNLINLYLSSNKLTVIPAEIGNLKNLTQLNLEYNQLSSLPTEIGNLTKLYFLDLIGNQLTFAALEPIVQKNIPGVFYNPQANIPIYQKGGALSVSAGGTLSKNTYTWYKVGQAGNTTIKGDSVFHPTQSGQYYAAIINSICTQLTLNTDTVYYSGTLPVNFVNLKAQRQGSIVNVSWTSLTEVNVQHYEIEHSPDSRNYTGIGMLPAKGGSVTQLQYVYNDVKPFNGDNFYRVKAVDKDGAVTYSNTVRVNMPGERNTMLVYPNPTRSVLNIQLNGSATFSLLNSDGKILLVKPITYSAAIDVSHFAAGVYYLKDNSTGEVKKVVIEK